MTITSGATVTSFLTDHDYLVLKRDHADGLKSHDPSSMDSTSESLDYARKRLQRRIKILLDRPAATAAAP